MMDGAFDVGARASFPLQQEHRRRPRHDERSAYRASDAHGSIVWPPRPSGGPALFLGSVDGSLLPVRAEQRQELRLDLGARFVSRKSPQRANDERHLSHVFPAIATHQQVHAHL